jgi:ribosome-associated toxin RatA of RatAB toxin-antitoxin module
LEQHAAVISLMDQVCETVIELDTTNSSWIRFKTTEFSVPVKELYHFFQLTATSDDTTELVIGMEFDNKDEVMANTLKEMFTSIFHKVADGIEFYAMLTKCDFCLVLVD